MLFRLNFIEQMKLSFRIRWLNLNFRLENVCLLIPQMDFNGEYDEVISKNSYNN